MIKRNNKKGFTIVELVIVIAVIAILAAVLIPTFAGVIKKANLSADIQAVRQMNTLLATYTEGVDNIADVKAKLSADNIDANDYKPLSKDHDFFWVPSLNRVILVDPTGAVIAPEDLIQKATDLKASWKSLGGVGNAAAVDNLVKEVGSKSEVVLTGTTNFQGASINLKPTAGATLKIGGTESAPATITNFVSDEGSKVASNTGVFANNTYYAGLISSIPANTTVTIENLIIDGAVIGDTTQAESAQVGIIAGNVKGNLIIKNVTIKNCVVFGMYKVGALVGEMGSGATLTIENVTIENTVVKGNNQTATLVGINNGTITLNGDLNKTNVTVVASEFNSDYNPETIDVEGFTHSLVNSGSGNVYSPQRTDKDYWVYTTDTTHTDGNTIWTAEGRNVQ